MLDTVRAFCAERLAEAGEAERFRAAHAAHFLALAEGAEPHLMRAEQLDWLRRLDDEHDNLHGALRHALLDHDHRLALRLLAALTPYWWLRGVRGVGAALAGELIGELGTEPPPGLAEEYAMCVLHAASGPPGRDLRVHLKTVDAMMAGQSDDAQASLPDRDVGGDQRPAGGRRAVRDRRGPPLRGPGRSVAPGPDAPGPRLHPLVRRRSDRGRGRVRRWRSRGCGRSGSGGRWPRRCRRRPISPTPAATWPGR